MTQPADHSAQVPATAPNGYVLSLAMLILRLALGFTFIYTGSQKLFGAFGGVGMETFSQYLGTMPTFLPKIVWAYMAALAEFAGGVCILLGLLTRLSVIPILIVMFVAIATVHGQNGFTGYYDATKGMQVGYAFNVALIAMGTALLIAGPGKLSLDALFFRACGQPKPAQP